MSKPSLPYVVGRCLGPLPAGLPCRWCGSALVVEFESDAQGRPLFGCSSCHTSVKHTFTPARTSFTRAKLCFTAAPVGSVAA